MGNFNTVKEKANTVYTYEGAEAYSREPLSAWLNMLFSSFLEDQFYEKRKSQLKRFNNLTQQIADKYGYTFVGKAAFFARNELGMRSVSQYVAAWLNDKTFEQKRNFYRAFFHRPDDVAEIFAAIDQMGEKRSHALIRGAADYLSEISAYTLGKYKMHSRQYNMYDLINITHAHSSVIDAYKKNILENPDTWEVKISTQKTKEERYQEWIELVEKRQLGYIALIRNLNNILEAVTFYEDFPTTSWIQMYLVPQIRNEQAIRKSLIFPYRIYTAYRNLKIKDSDIVKALDSAFRIAVQNMPTFDGRTGIILDVSGSMRAPISRKSQISIAEVGACFAIALKIANPQSICIKFGAKADMLSDSFKFKFKWNIFDMINHFASNGGCGHATVVSPAFKLLKKNSDQIDRIFLISDFQVMDADSNWSKPGLVTNLYTSLFNNTPLYSFDLANYNNQILNSSQHNIHYCTALNDSICKLISYNEQGEKELFNVINQIQF